MKRMTLLVLLIVLWGCKETDEPTTPPNILFILADDLGYNDIGCMGSDFYQTPNIDRIATEGATFVNGYAACQVCSPSRASIMTGKYPPHHGITDWIGAPVGEDWRRAKRYTKMLPPDYEHQLSHDDLVLPEALRDNGYATFFAGKWHLGNEGSYPQDHGFEVNQGGYERGGPYSGGFFSPFNNPQMEDHPEEVGMSLPEKLAKETCQFMEQVGDKPFLAYLSFYAVHAPIQTTQKNWSKYQKLAVAKGVEEEGFGMERRLPYRLKQDNPVYAGLIEHMDDAVGTVLDKLAELGYDENTIVIFTSDNGGVVSGDNYSTNLSPLRGGKGYQWEGGIKVPYLIKVPHLDIEGKRFEQRVSGIDFYPTLLDLAGVERPAGARFDGRSIVPYLQGRSQDDRALVWHYPHYGNQGGDPSSIIIKNDKKLIHYHENDVKELYDLKSDVGEVNDLAASSPQLVNELFAELERELSRMQARYPVEDPKFSLDSFQIKEEYFRTTVKDRLEGQRRKMLDPNYTPNEDWWGSSLVEE